ncbi:hypothetical protein IG631_00982 [Alternaria alternata]|jgi:hypothetical protein|nr:hypothetical protein IG631_00982 [Alternaria alternata]
MLAVRLGGGGWEGAAAQTSGALGRGMDADADAAAHALPAIMVLPNSL